MRGLYPGADKLEKLVERARNIRRLYEFIVEWHPNMYIDYEGEIRSIGDQFTMWGTDVTVYIDSECTAVGAKNIIRHFMRVINWEAPGYFIATYLDDGTLVYGYKEKDEEL